MLTGPSKTDGVCSFSATRADKNTQHKILINELAEVINEVLLYLGPNKVGKISKATIYRYFLEKGYFTQQQVAPSTFYRLVLKKDVLIHDTTEKLRREKSKQQQALANNMCRGMDLAYVTDENNTSHRVLAIIDYSSRKNHTDAYRG